MKTHFPHFPRAFVTSTSLVLAAVLSACGGGGDVPAAATAAATISGTAATGAAIASGAVTLKCVGGTSSGATTGADGRFSIDVSGVTLPCVVRVTYKDASGATQSLHSLATAAGNVNITPFTEMMVASATGGTPATAFDSFDATKTKAITAAQLTAAAGAVKTYLGNLGVATANMPADPIGGKFTPAIGGAAGDAADKVLDDLSAKLKTAAKKLSDVAIDIGKGGTGAAGGGGGGGNSGGGVAAGTLAVSAASNATRNGSYTPVGAKGTKTGSTDFYFSGTTADNKLETEIWVSSTGTILAAHIWFINGTSNKFFGCDGGKSIPCLAIGWEPLLKQVLFNGATLAEVDFPTAFDGSAADKKVSGGETLVVNGSIEIK